LAVVALRTQPILGREDSLDVATGGAARPEPHLLEARPVVTVPLAQHDHACRDRFDPTGAVVGEPGLGRLGDGRGPAARAVPADGVGDRAVGRELEHECVAAAVLEPFPRRLHARGSRLGDPATEDAGVPTLVQAQSSAGDGLSRQRVAAAAAVAVGELAGGGDDEGRIGGDEPETFLTDGRVEVALTPLDVLDAVQRGIEPGEPKRTRVQVGTDHARAVLRGQECVHARSGAEVER
jgi:hypothetical protein